MNLLFISRHVVPDDRKQMCITKASVVKWYPLNPNPGLRLGLTKKTKPALNERFASHWFSFMSIGNGIDPLPEAPVRKWGYRLGERGKGWNVAFILAADSLPDVNHWVNTPPVSFIPSAPPKTPEGLRKNVTPFKCWESFITFYFLKALGCPIGSFLSSFFLHSFFCHTEGVDTCCVKGVVVDACSMVLLIWQNAPIE